MQNSILIVEDEPSLRSIVADALKAVGFLVETAPSLAQMWRILQKPGNSTNLVLLDLTLPDGDGLEECKKIRRNHEVGVIMMTGRIDSVDMILGLESGADDYIPKPFEIRELIARVRSVLRRVVSVDISSSASCFMFDGWTFKPAEWELTHKDSDEPIALTQYEAQLLEKLLDGHGRALTRDELTLSITGRHHSPLDRSIDNLVSRIRKKIAIDPASTGRIKPVRGEGYRFFGDVDRL